MQRPYEYNKIIAQDELVYASYTRIGGMWMRGLFSKNHIPEGTIISLYRGKILTKDELEYSNSDYLMTARCNSDRRKRIVLDGDVDKYHNICGFANYAVHGVANAFFEDKLDSAIKKEEEDTSVILRARTDIDVGCEIRTDYDMGSTSTPFLQMLLNRGIPMSNFTSSEYTKVMWVYPTTLNGAYN